MMVFSINKHVKNSNTIRRHNEGKKARSLLAFTPLFNAGDKRLMW